MEGKLNQREEFKDEQEGKFLTFQIGKEEYGLEIACVTEIIGLQQITDLPDVPNFVKGVINLRGKVIPVLDVRLRFDFEELEYNERTCIIVVNIEDVAVGLIVDSVSEVMDIDPKNIQKPTQISKNSSSRYIREFGKVGDEVKILLDTQKLLFEDEIQLLKNKAKN